MKITREQRWHFSYPDTVSAQVEREYYAPSLKLPANFTGFLSRKERLQEEQRRKDAVDCSHSGHAIQKWSD